MFQQTDNYDGDAVAGAELTLLWSLLSKVLTSSRDCAFAVNARFCSSSAIIAFSLKTQNHLHHQTTYIIRESM